MPFFAAVNFVEFRFDRTAAAAGRVHFEELFLFVTFYFRRELGGGHQSHTQNNNNSCFFSLSIYLSMFAGYTNARFVMMSAESFCTNYLFLFAAAAAATHVICKFTTLAWWSLYTATALQLRSTPPHTSSSQCSFTLDWNKKNYDAPQNTKIFARAASAANTEKCL